ncbi:MAG: ATP-binding protein [Planctomycetota bacterium]
MFHDVLGTIAHHVNNAFAVVMARAESLRRRELDPDLSDFLELCIARGTEVHQLVCHLQDLADTNTELLGGELIDVKLPKLVEAVAEAPAPDAGRGRAMMGRLVHEIKNALGGVLSTAELVHDELDLEGSPLAASMKILLGQVGRTTSLIHLLGESAGRGRSIDGPVEILGLVDEVIELVREQAAGRIELRFDRSLGPCRCRLDAGVFQAALLNVLINAVDAIPSGGTIEIRADWDGPEYLVFEIRDDGIGVEPEQLSQIFEPFFATRPDGFGLGLCVAERFLQKLDGELQLESTKGTGSCVRITLPLEPPARLVTSSGEAQP